MSAITTAVVSTLQQPVLVLDPDLTVVLANRAFLECFEVAEADTVDCPLYQLGNGQWDVPELRDLLDRLRRDGTREIKNYRVDHEFEGIGRRIMLVNATRLREKPHQERILVAISDVTERERMENELIARLEFSEKLIDSVRDALLVLDRDLHVQSANRSFYSIFQLSPDEVTGRRLYDIGDGQWDIPELRAALEDILPKEQIFDDFEMTHDFPRIGRRTMLLNGRQLDHMPCVLLAIRDETEQRRQQADQWVMVGELQHRVKNILANVQAIATSTLRRSRDLGAFEDAFLQRLASLARTQDLLMKGPSGEVQLYQLVAAEMSAHGWEADGRLAISGPPVSLSRREVQAVAMVVHELATNAVKYGAFAVPEGRLDITWRTETEGQDARLFFEWRESGIELQEKPRPRGFGTGLIEHSIGHMLGGKSRLEFLPSGVLCTVSFALAGEES